MQQHFIATKWLEQPHQGIGRGSHKEKTKDGGECVAHLHARKSIRYRLKFGVCSLLGLVEPFAFDLIGVVVSGSVA